MTPELRTQLEASRNLPSPPAVATRIISLANDPEADINGIAEALERDPAISSKVLRFANSPLYGHQRKIESLRQAVVILGLNATISLALSFSLLKSWQFQSGGRGLDYLLYWRRALLTATISRVLAKFAGLRDTEELFLACLIQDVGILALDRSIDGIYDGIGEEQVHQERLIEQEISKLGTDHAAIGGWLMERWNFPERIQQAVAASHNPERVPRGHANSLFARCVALAGLISEVFMDQTGERRFQAVAEAARKHLGADTEQFGVLLQEVAALIPEAETVFETQIMTKSSPEAILQEASETLMLRNLRTLQFMDAMRDHAESLETKSRVLEETSLRDTLTGLYNRRYLARFLGKAFDDTGQSGEPLSIAFADLDRFKSINDTYGHQAGDQILATTAGILKAGFRSSDVVARYGGEEFLLVFPGTDAGLAEIICNRVVVAFQQARHDVGEKKDLVVTISVGIATHSGGCRFGSVDELVRAADRALYVAKLQGRNRCVPFRRHEQG